MTTQDRAHQDTLALSDPELLCARGYVDGAWCAADGGETFAVTNPATGALVAEVPAMGAAETRRAIEAAQRAWPAWRGCTAQERARVLRRWAELILATREDLAVLLTAEQGKPLAEARGEVGLSAAFLEWFAEEARRVYGDIIPASQPDRRVLVLTAPVGVCAAITPWNFPSSMLARKVAPALAAGCTVVAKPAEQTPLSALALAKLAERAGLPPGVLNVLTGPPAPIGAELTANPTVRKLSFTGSTEVGRLLMRECAPTVKKLSLELGGNAPFIVFDDAELDAAVEGALACKFRNAGQTCVSANRCFVHESVYEAFSVRFAARVASLRVGNGLDPAVAIGPLIDQAAIAKVMAHIDDAVGGGARVALGGKRHGAGPLFFEPTVLTEVTASMLVATEETFGPVAPVLRFRSEAEVIELANATEYGLAAYFYARDLGRVWRVAEALEYGIVGVNCAMPTSEVAAPFGGMKHSGFGREASKYGIEEYLERKYVCLGGMG